MNSHLEELKNEIEDESNIEDIFDEEVESEPSIARYDITSYGIDFDVEGLVKRIKRGDIFIPPFQRNFVWKLPESSRLIESLLLGLPVPGIFLAQDQGTGKMLVIDGQQRLLSLQYFFDGFFNPRHGDDTQKVFRLEKVQKPYLRKTYFELDPKDRINLENCVIHATVVKQDSPSEDDTSIFHIFERLNSGGRRLSAQEIRTAVYHGNLIENIKRLNSNASWRKIYGKINERMKDQELITRFFAVFDSYMEYKKPMIEFINLFCKKYRSISDTEFKRFEKLFIQCCDSFSQINDGKPFRLASALNVAFFEAAMVGLSVRLVSNPEITLEDVQKGYDFLRNSQEFKDYISQSTGDQTILKSRVELAISAFKL